MILKTTKFIAFIILCGAFLILAACGTLDISAEPGVVGGQPGTPTEMAQPTLTIAEAGATTPTAAPSEEDSIAAEATPTPTETVTEIEESGDSDESATKPSEITPIDETWSRYTNYQLGFSINFPKTMVHFYGSCRWNEENGDHSYRPELTAVPVEVFEDGDTTYITSAYYYELTGETKETSADGGERAFFSECQEVTNSLELLRDPDNHYQSKWAIVAIEVHDDGELEGFIQSRYGEGCSLGEKAPSGQEGVYDIRIQGDGKDLSESSCPLNYGTVVKYYPEQNKVIAWDTGQAATFVGDIDYSVIYDQDMIDSFQFLTDVSPPDTADSAGLDYSGWQSYTNDTIGYSLMVPGQADVMGGNVDESVQFVGPLVEGEHWPWFFVDHYDSAFFHPPAGTELRQWLTDSIPYEPLEEDANIGGLPAVHFTFEASPQAYGRDEYYLVHGDQLIKITILHAGGLQDWSLYDQFLQGFTFSPV